MLTLLTKQYMALSGFHWFSPIGIQIIASLQMVYFFASSILDKQDNHSYWRQ